MTKTNEFYWIGIDCGTNTGIAVWAARAAEFILLESYTFWEVFDYVCAEFAPYSAAVAIEDPAQNKPVWHSGGNKRTDLHIAQQVGGVKRESRLMMEGLDRQGFLVKAVDPNDSKTKLDADQFEQYTGCTMRTNEHSRDAGMLVYRHTALTKPQMQLMQETDIAT